VISTVAAFGAGVNPTVRSAIVSPASSRSRSPRIASAHADPANATPGAASTGLGPATDLVPVPLLGRRQAREEVDLEPPVDQPAARLRPRPALLHELRPLADHRGLLDPAVRAEVVPDADVEPVAFEPLRELARGERLPGEIAHRGEAARDALEILGARLDLHRPGLGRSVDG
jgi:hypothetical protein